jgi:CheY-like chemotaxis protein
MSGLRDLGNRRSERLFTTVAGLPHTAIARCCTLPIAALGNRSVAQALDAIFLSVSGSPLSTEVQPLAGYRFLIVEDEILQAQRLGALIAAMGGSVAEISYGFEQARQAISDTTFDCAILDVNLNGTLAFQLAEALERQKIPFIFCTAYAEAVDVYPGASRTPRVDKPIRPSRIRDALLEVLKPRVNSS